MNATNLKPFDASKFVSNEKTPVVSDDFEPGQQMDDVNIVCPYCGHKHQAEAEDADENPNEEECGECGKTFTRWAFISVTYHTQQQEEKPCVNQA